jgi:hypothetical protein
MSESAAHASVFIDSAADELANQGILRNKTFIDIPEEQQRRKHLFQFVISLDPLRNGLKELCRRLVQYRQFVVEGRIELVIRL